MSEESKTGWTPRAPCLALALALTGGFLGGIASPFFAAMVLELLPVDHELLGPYLMVIVFS